MLPNLPSGEVTHASLAPRETSKPAYLDRLHECFFVLSRQGEIWRSNGDKATVTELVRNRCVSIPPGVRFQYRSKDVPLHFLVVVAPRWTEEQWHEAPAGYWDPDTEQPSAGQQMVGEDTLWETRDLPADPDYGGPDGSEIRLLLESEMGGVAHARLRAGATSQAVQHQTVDEIRYVLGGEGEVWRGDGRETIFQWRSLGSSPLDALIGTFPRRPGPEEAAIARGRWDPSGFEVPG